MKTLDEVVVALKGMVSDGASRRELAGVVNLDGLGFVGCYMNGQGYPLLQDPGPTLAFKDRGGDASAAVKLKDEDLAFIERCGMKPEAVMRHMPPPGSSSAARREREALRLKAAEMAGPLDAAETAEMKALSQRATAGTLNPAGQDRLVALLDRSLAAFGGGR
ncbi:MAG TPA: hypothetical protein VGK94_08365 [Candidatus Polarisedimenticolia bacterium]|jgi:hypothetical protein